VILVNAISPTYAMTATTSSSNGIAAVAKGTDWTLGDDGHIRLGSSTTVLSLIVKSITGSSIVLWDGSSQYLRSASSGSRRYLTLGTSSSTWTITISNGAATLSYKGSGGMGNTTYYVRYNNNYFSLSTSSKTVALYKKGTVESTVSVDLADDPVLEYAEYGAFMSGKNLIYNASTDQLSREYGSDGTLTFAILAKEEEQVVEFAGIPASDITLGDSFALRLTFISGITTEIDETYTVYVVKEEGHTLWLTDGNGNGFIVKR
jgi:hypothetical protein